MLTCCAEATVPTPGPVAPGPTISAAVKADTLTDVVPADGDATDGT